MMNILTKLEVKYKVRTSTAVDGAEELLYVASRLYN